jgi:hypothetical protein
VSRGDHYPTGERARILNPVSVSVEPEERLLEQILTVGVADPMGVDHRVHERLVTRHQITPCRLFTRGGACQEFSMFSHGRSS